MVTHFSLANQKSVLLHMATQVANRNTSCEEAEEMALRLGRAAYRGESVL